MTCPNCHTLSAQLEAIRNELAKIRQEIAATGEEHALLVLRLDAPARTMQQPSDMADVNLHLSGES